MKFTASTISLCFTPPEAHQVSRDERGGDCFRRVLARAVGNGPSMDEVRREIFWLSPPKGEGQQASLHFDDRTWHGRHGRPQYVIATGDGCGVITSLSPEANRLLLASVGALQDALHVHWGKRPAVKVNEHSCALDLSCGEVTRYRIGQFCINDECASRAKFWLQFKDAPSGNLLTDRALLRRIERRILMDVETQCQNFGWKLPDIGQLRIFGLDAHRLSPVNVRGVKFTPRCDITFQSTSRLTGHWFIGSLISRGFGKLQTDFMPRGRFQVRPRKTQEGQGSIALV